MNVEKMYQIPAFELLPAEPTHLSELDSYDSDMSYVICDNPDKVLNDVTTALPSSSQDLILPDGAISLMHERIKNIFSENILLKEKMKNSNSMMTELLNSISNWHNQIYQTHERYRNMIKNLTTQNEKLQAKNEELVENKLEDNEETVVCQKSNNIGNSSCEEDTLLQNSDFQNQILDTICKFSEEKIDFKRTSEELEELKASQETSDELRKQSSERLSEMTATLLDTQKKLAAAEETVERFKRTSEDLEELKASQEKSDELRKQSSERLSEMTITLADTQKKLEVTEETVKELENTLKEMEKLKASYAKSEEMGKENSEALAKVMATLTEATAKLTDNQKKLTATAEAVEKLENELKLKEEDLKASQDAYKELTKQNTKKLEMLEVAQNKLVAAEEAAKTFTEVFEALECESLKYKKELLKVQSSNDENMRNIDELKKVIVSYSEAVERSNAECERHKENQKTTELSLVKISEEQERWKRVHNSLEREISDSEISSAWEQVHLVEGPEKVTAWENLITAYQEQLETVTSKLYDTQKALEEERETSSQLNTSIQQILVSSNETVNDLLERSGCEAGASANQSIIVASTFSCPCCLRCFDDLFDLQSHVEECLNLPESADF